MLNAYQHTPVNKDLFYTTIVAILRTIPLNISGNRRHRVLQHIGGITYGVSVPTKTLIQPTTNFV